MKIEKLPLLSSDFTIWTWAESNGIAQDSSTRVSYFALVNKDFCSKFVGEVWNDLVRKLNSALTYAGIQWDSTYGDVSDVLLDTSIRANREFKAFMFNAVVLNINQFGFIHWNWERTNDMPGFLGRTYMRGYSEYGRNSDFIYGWYILELAEKLNTLIRVLKNEGPFREYEGLIPVASCTPAEVYSTRSGILVYQDKSEIIINSSLALAYAIEIKRQEKALSYVTGKPINGFPQKINTSIETCTDVNAKVALAKRQDILGHGLGETFSGSELTGIVFVQRLLCASEIRAKYSMGLAMSYSPKLKFAESINSNELAKMICVPYISWLETAENRSSCSATELALAEIVIMSVIPKANSFSNGEIILRDKLLVNNIQRPKSYSVSSMNYKRSQYMRRLIKSSSYQNNGINTKVSAPMKKSETIWSYYKNDIVTRVVAIMKKTLESSTKYIGNVYTGFGKPLDFLGEQEKTHVNGTVKVMHGEFVDAQIKSNSYANGEIAHGIPKLVEGIVYAQEHDISELQLMPCEVVGFKGDSNTLHDAKVVTKLSEGIKGKCKAATAVVCILEFEATKETWYDPVQNGTNLYIRNAYPQWQEGMDVHLDGGIYYEPEQIGTNVYIRSAENLKGGW